MSEHTSGPWKVVRRFEIYQDTQKPGIGGTFVASTKGNAPLPENINVVCEADARLIAAAPEMLDALRLIANLDYSQSAINCAAYQAVQVAKAAIAKAEGTS